LKGEGRVEGERGEIKDVKGCATGDFLVVSLSISLSSVSLSPSILSISMRILEGLKEILEDRNDSILL
jgi:hypothetical protein